MLALDQELGGWCARRHTGGGLDEARAIVFVACITDQGAAIVRWYDFYAAYPTAQIHTPTRDRGIGDHPYFPSNRAGDKQCHAVGVGGMRYMEDAEMKIGPSTPTLSIAAAIWSPMT